MSLAERLQQRLAQTQPICPFWKTVTDKLSTEDLRILQMAFDYGVPGSDIASDLLAVGVFERSIKTVTMNLQAHRMKRCCCE